MILTNINKYESELVSCCDFTPSMYSFEHPEILYSRCQGTEKNKLHFIIIVVFHHASGNAGRR